jgi:predicted RNase H-like nuclease
VTIIAGVDLAWSGRKPTGLCLIEASEGQLALLELRCTEALDADGVFQLLAALGPDVVAGIDAPLVVGPGRRAEAELARAFGRQGVYAYSARMDFLERRRIAEGPKLGALLGRAGWNLDPSRVTARASGRHAVEVFPHAITVSLLGSERALRYKKGPLAARLAPLTAFQSLLRDHCESVLPGVAREILHSPIVMSPARAMKAVEDQLDALACAIAAYHAWRHGPPGTFVFGDAANGYIAVPRPITSSQAPSCP